MFLRHPRKFYCDARGKDHHKEEVGVDLPVTRSCYLKCGYIVFSAYPSYSCLYGLWSGSVSPANERLAQKYPDAALRTQSQTWWLSKWKAEKQSKFHTLLPKCLCAGPEWGGVARQVLLPECLSVCRTQGGRCGESALPCTAVEVCPAFLHLVSLHALTDYSGHHPCYNFHNTTNCPHSTQGIVAWKVFLKLHLQKSMTMQS